MLLKIRSLEVRNHRVNHARNNTYFAKSKRRYFFICPAPYPRVRTTSNIFPLPGPKGKTCPGGCPGGGEQVKLNHPLYTAPLGDILRKHEVNFIGLQTTLNWVYHWIISLEFTNLSSVQIIQSWWKTAYAPKIRNRSPIKKIILRWKRLVTCNAVIVINFNTLSL